MERFHLTVDSSVRSVECGPNTPLLYVLRNDLGIAAVRFGCGEGMCGACDVLVDGRAVHSCQTPVWAVTGKAVTTAAGLGCAGAPHPVQCAFIQEQATQCGYCVPGLLIRAAELLNQEPNPTERDVRHALDGNLCRCGSHNRVVRAVLRAAEASR